MMIGLRNALVGNRASPSGEYWGLCFTAEQANSTVKLGQKIGSSKPTAYFAISYDGQTWQDYTEETVITLQNVGDKVYFAARGNSVNTQMSSGARYIRGFTTTGAIAASGNVMSLVKNDPIGWQNIQLGEYCFARLFYQNNITTAPELPATLLEHHCYQLTFGVNSKLKTPPTILPCTSCYSNMYHQMFYNCSNLETAPEIMLTTNNQPSSMIEMFNGCKKLNSIKVHLSEWGTSSNGSCTRSWLYDVASQGTFYCPTALGTNETIARSSNNCPTNWTVVNI